MQRPMGSVASIRRPAPSTSRGAVRSLIVAAAMLFAAFVPSSASYAQSGPFAGLAGVWSGGGTVTLDDGSTERIRCRATYAVGSGGNGLNQSLTCASDSYRFNLASNVVASGGSLSGTWSESSRGVTGNLEGRGGQRQLPGHRQRTGVQREYYIDHARQQAVRRDQGREPVPGRIHFAVALVSRNALRFSSSEVSASSVERPYPSWFWRSAAPAPC